MDDANDVVLSGGHALAATGGSSGALRIFDVSNPAAPFETGSVSLPGAAVAVTVDDHLVSDGFESGDTTAWSQVEP